MVILFLLLFVGLELKHVIADYFLQPGWMIAGKGDFGRIGGYAHAGVHAVMSLIVLLIAGIPILATVGIVAAEFVVHYLLDFSKIQYSKGVHVDTQPHRFWSLHGVDQMGHQLTYGVMIYAAVLSMGYA